MSENDVDVTVSAQTSTPEAPQRRYHIVFVSDLGAGERLAGLCPIDKDDFAGVLGKARPTLALAIPDPLGGGDEWEFQLVFDSLKAFDPAGVLAQVPGARWRLGVRDKLAQRRLGKIDQAELDAALSAAVSADESLAWMTQVAAPADAAPGAPPKSPASGSILDAIDEPDEAGRVSAEVERLAAGAGDAKSKISGTQVDRLTSISNRLERELGGIADAIVKHVEFRRLETAWRGLKFLVDQIDFREGTRLCIVHAAREQLVDALIEHVIDPAFEGEIPTPGLIVCDYDFANTTQDIEQLDLLAQHCASLPAPAVLPLSAAFFDIKSLRLLRNLPNLTGLISGWQFAKWRSLRDQPYSKSLIPILGRFILRAPHARRADAAEFTFDESVGKIGELLWGGGHLAMAVCAARSFATHQWPTRMFGSEAGKIADLPLVPNPNDPQSSWGPGDLTLEDRRLDELPEIGINLLQSIKGKDHCMLLGGVSAARPVQTAEVGAQQAALEISLPYQQFANIASAWICEQTPKLSGKPADEIQQALLFGLTNLIGVKSAEDQNAVRVGVGENPDGSGSTVVQIRLEPPGRIVPGGLHLDFGFTV